MRILRTSLTLPCGLFSILLIGCQQDSVSTYQAPQGERFDYVAPDSWKKRGPDPDGLYVTAFQVWDGGRRANITVTPFPGEAGGVISNVNRWRGRDLKLEPLSEEEIRQVTLEISVAGKPAYYVDLSTPDLANPNRPRVLGVIAPRGSKTWFFKMVGPASLVENQKGAFEAFMKSVSFGEQTGNNNG